MRMDNHKVLTRAEERALALRYRAGDKAAGNTLIACNQRFAAREAWKWARGNVDFEDLMQEANVGMLRALECFDPDKGIKFMSYAVHWIHQRLSSRVRDDCSLVKIGTTNRQRMLFSNLRGTMSRLRADGCPEELLVEEAARETGTKAVDVEAMLSRITPHVSLSAPVAESGSLTRGDMLVDGAASAEEQLSRWGDTQSVRRALRFLDERERYIVTHRTMADPPLTLRQVGERFGFSRTTAANIENAALEKLRRLLAHEEAA